jgi:lipopolysaccharide/colanic/teichoic acid biosynthesis glycosyltransferase
MPLTAYRRWGKRVFDVIVSATALLVFAPLLAVLAVLVRCLHGSPILFRQVRTGQNGKAFTILKFRTMTNACDAAGVLLPETQRLTRFGRFLRATSLDELPELLNVLWGEMSLVGPRPLLPQYDAYYSERENLRFSVPPGITGWAQVNGRNDLAWDHRLECDAWYAESCSFVLDMRILLVTVKKVLRRDNVQVDPALTFGALDEERRIRNQEAGGRGQETGSRTQEAVVSEQASVRSTIAGPCPLIPDS